MSPRRFKLEIDGCMFFCAAFENQVELDQALGSALHVAPQTEPEPPRAELDTRPRGRPSFYDLIAAAAHEIEGELEALPTAAARARRVLRQIARDAEAEDIPSTATVEKWLRTQPSGKNAGKNVRKNREGLKSIPEDKQC